MGSPTGRAEGAEEVPATGPALVVRDLSVVARAQGKTRPLLRGIDLQLEPGEILGVVGESGSGKSTLCRALARILPPALSVDGGTATLGEVDLLRQPAAAIHRLRAGGVGMIFQEPYAALNPVMRVGDQMIEAVRARRPLSQTEARRETIELLEHLGLPEAERRLSAYPHEFSGGQCQRLATAVALAGDPSVLFADEPTSALDVTTQAQILDLLKALARERRMGVVLVLHNYAVVAQLCRRTMVMYAGSVVEEGPTAQLLSEPRHPYTAALIAALPQVDRRLPTLAVIPGRPPVPGETREGCPFQPRCKHAEEQCARGAIPLAAVAPGHLSACKRVEEIWPPRRRTPVGSPGSCGGANRPLEPKVGHPTRAPE